MTTYSPYMTQLTREILDGKANPTRNMWNRKPFRTQRQKIAALGSAVKCNDGAWRSTAMVSIHPAPRKGA